MKVAASQARDSLSAQLADLQLVLQSQKKKAQADVTAARVRRAHAELCRRPLVVPTPDTRGQQQAEQDAAARVTALEAKLEESQGELQKLKVTLSYSHCMALLPLCPRGVATPARAGARHRRQVLERALQGGARTRTQARGGGGRQRREHGAAQGERGRGGAVGPARAHAGEGAASDEAVRAQPRQLPQQRQRGSGARTRGHGDASKAPRRASAATRVDADARGARSFATCSSSSAPPLRGSRTSRRG
jgi:hypothetical protein